MMLEPDSALLSLREAGLRATPQRRAVIDVLAGNTEHPSAEQIAESVRTRMPGVSLSTVYKTLHELAALGLVRELDLTGGMRFDPDSAEHAHLVCERCGTVVDVELPAELASALLSLGARAGGSADHLHVEMRGACRTCSGPSAN